MHNYNLLARHSIDDLEKAIGSLRDTSCKFGNDKLLKSWEEQEGHQALRNYFSLKQDSFPQVFSINPLVKNSQVDFRTIGLSHENDSFYDSKEKVFHRKIKYYMISLRLLRDTCLREDISEYEESYNKCFSLINSIYKTNTVAGRLLIDDLNEEIRDIFTANQKQKPTRLSKEGFFIKNKFVVMLGSTTQYYKFVNLLISKNCAIASHEEIYDACRRKKNLKPDQVPIFCNKLRYDLLQKIVIDSGKEEYELFDQTIVSSEDYTNDGKAIRGYKIIF